MHTRAKDYICDLTPYRQSITPGVLRDAYGVTREDIVQLDSNENPLGPSPRALAALRAAAAESNRYPDQSRLIHALAKHHHVSPDMITLGNGSNDVLDLIARTYLGPGDEAVLSQYSFAVYKIATQSTGATSVVVPARAYGHDLEALLRAITPATKVIWLDNPGNPTGAFTPYSDVLAFLRELPKRIVVVLDEAYYEYLNPTEQKDSVGWLAKRQNLVLVRTFSKIHGLAGMRIGYGVAHPRITGLLNSVRQPFNVSTLALQAAAAALADTAHVRDSYEAVRLGKAQLVGGLRKLSVSHLPAHGNFVTVRLQDAASVNQKLLTQGVIVRPLGGYDMPDWLRVTVGRPDENQHFLHSLGKILHA